MAFKVSGLRGGDRVATLAGLPITCISHDEVRSLSYLYNTAKIMTIRETQTLPYAIIERTKG